MNNLKRLKKLVLANKETRRLYRMMQFLAIFMVISCTIIVVVAKWIEQDQNQKREELFGSWDEVFLDVPAEDLNYFKQNAFLEQISIQSIQEKVFLEGDKRVVIGSCDDNFLEMGNIELLEGRMPEKENEVAVEEEYLEVLGVTGVGSYISINSNVRSLRNYKVVGIIKNYSSRWSNINKLVKFTNCFVENVPSKSINVYVIYNKWADKDPEINILNYYENIDSINVDYTYSIVKLFSYTMGLIAILIYNLCMNLRNNYKRAYAKNKNLKKLYFSRIFIAFFESMLIFSFIRTTVGIFRFPIHDDENTFNILNKVIDANGDVIYRIQDIQQIYEYKVRMISLLEYFLNEFTNILILVLICMICINLKKLRYVASYNKRIEYYRLCEYFGMQKEELKMLWNEEYRHFSIYIIILLMHYLIYSYYRAVNIGLILLIYFSCLIAIIIMKIVVIFYTEKCINKDKKI